jgi:uncharacterized hydrophobic protein (TIGR00271 family)
MPLERREQVVRDLSESAKPGFDFFLLVILSTCIATLGLITNSPAVIIGAMLVAPLMSPIIGLGCASIIGDSYLLRNTLSALARGALLAVLLAALITVINTSLPFVSLQDLPSEILARTHPSPIDLGIALAGGLAAAYALAQPQLSAALPGVAIATALMPPLCTVGIGLALGRWDLAGGAGLLFITNAVTIAFASAFIFFLLGFGPAHLRRGNQIPKSLVLAASLTGILLVPLSYLSVQFFRQATENRLINTVVKNEVQKLNDSELAGLEVVRLGNTLDMNITIRTTSPLVYGQVNELQKAIVAGLKRPVSLVVNQILVEKLNPLIPPTATPTPTVTPTFTPGPSLTPTPRPSATSTPTPSPTFTPTSTLTPTPTETPAQAQISTASLPGFNIYQSPGGPVIGLLGPNQTVIVLYRTQVYDSLVWQQIMDAEGRVGWVPQVYLFRVTLTPEFTATPTPAQ